MERITKLRAGILLAAFALLMGIFSVRMYSVQVLGNNNVVNNATYTSQIRVRAARGDLLDTNGNILVGNRASYNMVFNNYVLLNSEDPNGSLLKLINLCREMGLEYQEHFPITMARPYEYTHDQYGSSWQTYFQSYLSSKGIDSDISANRLMELLRENLDIPAEWTDQEARLVIGVRYELALRQGITNLPSYEFILDIADTDMTAVLELNTPGLTAEVSTVREYYTDYASHILGTVGAISPEDWPEYQAKGYAMDAYVGVSGLEKAFEEYLHGTDGTLTRTVDKYGNVISEYYSVEPVAGKNVEISIDLNLQKAGEEAMAQVYQELRESNGLDGGGMGTDVDGGAVVAMDIRTGQILVCASYPTFSLATYYEDLDEINANPAAPLYNRALLATYPPGSTYKMCMAVAGLETGAITRYTTIYDAGIYTKYASSGFAPTCMIWANRGLSHGTITVAQALRDSCNYFFYCLAEELDEDTIDYYGKMFGLGESTGVELYEEVGTRANPENKSDGEWYTGDRIMSGIGQSEHAYTPLQLAVYVSTLANRGTRYAATFMNRVVSADYTQLIEECKPRIMSSFQISEETYQTVKEGMILVTTEGTASGYFYNWDNDVVVAGKTGTAEHGSGGSNHGSFVCFAPADDPQIAIVIYGERAGQGGNLSKVAQAIMDVYFAAEEASDVVTYENKVS